MAAEISVEILRAAVNAVLDHVVEDLNITHIDIDRDRDFYWHIPDSELYATSQKPATIEVGRLADDMDFVSLIKRGDSGDVAYNLVHVAPLLRFLAERIRA